MLKTLLFKFRVGFTIFVLCPIFASLLLLVLLATAGTTPGMLNELAVFTINNPAIGLGFPNKLSVPVNARRSEPAETILTSTIAAPTTLITKAPRSVGPVFQSNTDKADNGIESANPAALSKALQLKLKASTNLVEPDVDNNVEKREEALKNFHKAYLSFACSGTYVRSQGKDEAKVSTCGDSSLLNTLRWVALLYWAAISAIGAAFLTSFWCLYRPSDRMMTWTQFGLALALFMLVIGSVQSYGIAMSAAKLFGSISKNIRPDILFIGATWAATCLPAAGIASLVYAKRMIKKHLDIAIGDSGGFCGGAFGDPVMSGFPAPPPDLKTAPPPSNSSYSAGAGANPQYQTGGMDDLSHIRPGAHALDDDGDYGAKPSHLKMPAPMHSMNARYPPGPRPLGPPVQRGGLFPAEVRGAHGF